MPRIVRNTPVVVALLIGMAVLSAACGGGEEATATTAPAPAAKATTAPAPTATATTAPAPTAKATTAPAPTATPQPAVASPTPSSGQASKPKRGGKLVLAAHGPPSHWDFYASGTIANLGSQAAMFNQLIRRDPTDYRLPIIGDLARQWEMSGDGLRYTFRLHEGVKFHDGSLLTATDVEASYRRMIFPESYAPGLINPRKTVFEGVKEINVIDPLTVQFVLKGPRNPTMMMQAFSLQWNLISKKEVLESNKGNLREIDNHPGTGPYVYSRRTADRWIQTANPNYWNAGKGPNGCPCLDSIEHVWLVAWTPELAAALLGGQVDWAQWLDLKTGRTIGQKPGLNGLVQSIPVVAGNGWNISREPYNDKRVRKALALVIDGQAIVQAGQDIKGWNFGEWFINGTPFAMDPVKLLQLPGFRKPTVEDYAEAKRLLSEAGYPDGKGFPKIDMLTRDTPDSKVQSASVQAMIKEHLNLNGVIRIADVSGIADESLKGNFDYSGYGYGIILADPSAYIGQGFGADNQLRYKNPEVLSLIDQLAAEPDQARRILIVNKMRDIFLDEWPMEPFTAGESVFWGWWDRVKGLVNGSFTGSYELYRWDSVWLER